MKNEQVKPRPENKPNGAFNTETGKKIETTEEFRKAFRQKKLVIKI